ncbi:MAG: sulfotransferase [Kiritimatiellae bacterium]|nr:sulfotransferase [Kiritimatiellia bacterium]
MTLPNFLLVGAPKSGSTSLYEHLASHPDVYMCPIKEPCFFNDGMPEIARTVSEYEALFAGRRNERAVGEASTSYLADPAAAERIKKCLPEAKIVALLRNPADRAYSTWTNMFYTLGFEKLSFEEALREEENRIRTLDLPADIPFYYGHFFYFQIGLYARHLKRYLDLFGRARVSVHIFEEFVKAPAATCRALFSFLDVDDSFLPDFQKHNPAAVSRSSGLHRRLLRPSPVLMKAYNRLPMWVKLPVYKAFRALYWANLKPQPRPPVDAGIRAELLERYRSDIAELEELLGRDLSVWRAPKDTRGNGKEGTGPDSASSA